MLNRKTAREVRSIINMKLLLHLVTSIHGILYKTGEHLKLKVESLRLKDAKEVHKRCSIPVTYIYNNHAFPCPHHRFVIVVCLFASSLISCFILEIVPAPP